MQELSELIKDPQLLSYATSLAASVSIETLKAGWKSISHNRKEKTDAKLEAEFQSLKSNDELQRKIQLAIARAIQE